MQKPNIVLSKCKFKQDKKFNEDSVCNLFGERRDDNRNNDLACLHRISTMVVTLEQ